MTLTDRVLLYLEERGSITSYEAFTEFGVTRLSASIYQLRRRGYKILSEREESINRYGTTVWYVRYRLLRARDEQG